MDLEQAIELINYVMFAKSGRHLNDVKTAVFTGSWHHQTHEQIAGLSDCLISYTRKHIGALFWRLLSEALEENVSKTNFRVALERP